MTARYDGHADWYEEWSTSTAAAAMADAQAALVELLPSGQGLAVDVGCGTGLAAGSVRALGYDVLGVDLSSDQLRYARRRFPVVQADAHALPLPDGCARLVYSVLTHTDVEDFAGVVAEAVRILAVGGSFVYVGVHPCFVSPVAEPLPDGVRLHPGYRRSGWQERTPWTGKQVRNRVGVHHLPLEQLLNALLHPQAPLERVLERGGHDGSLPWLLAARMIRAR